MSVQPPNEEHDFGRLFVRHQPRIYGFIRSLVANRADAEDLLQETASVLWRKFDEYQPGSNFMAWAMRIARFQVMYYRQRQGRNVLQFSEQFVEAVSRETIAESGRLAGVRELLDICMEKLPPADRELFDLRYQTDMAAKSMAEKLGRPLSTVYNAVNRIRKALAECVEQAMDRAERERATEGRK